MSDELKFNTMRKCLDEKCGWVNVYDKNNDWRHVGDWKQCPKCKGPISEPLPYHPRC